jgi:hypothetical protein
MGLLDLCAFIVKQHLGIPSACSRAASARGNGTVRKRLSVRPVHHVQNHTCPVTLPSSQPGGPPCWASPLAFGLIECHQPLKRFPREAYQCYQILARFLCRKPDSAFTNSWQHSKQDLPMLQTREAHHATPGKINPRRETKSSSIVPTSFTRAWECFFRQIYQRCRSRQSFIRPMISDPANAPLQQTYSNCSYTSGKVLQRTHTYPC